MPIKIYEFNRYYGENATNLFIIIAHPSSAQNVICVSIRLSSQMNKNSLDLFIVPVVLSDFIHKLLLLIELGLKIFRFFILNFIEMLVILVLLCFFTINANAITYQRDGLLIRMARQADDEEVPRGATVSAIATGPPPTMGSAVDY